MSESARELPADSKAVPHAVEEARNGVITHLTVRGERVVAIVPESVIEDLEALRETLDILSDPVRPCRTRRSG